MSEPVPRSAPSEATLAKSTVEKIMTGNCKRIRAIRTQRHHTGLQKCTRKLALRHRKVHVKVKVLQINIDEVYMKVKVPQISVDQILDQVHVKVKILHISRDQVHVKSRYCR